MQIVVLDKAPGLLPLLETDWVVKRAITKMSTRCEANAGHALWIKTTILVVINDAVIGGTP